ncbi:UDP-N-acetylmuramate dehydrogenase [Dellaglioa algida]|uniref:UDP-N-acetylenolpyruvoylglucosamine reductase n=1 Tax=Dellaglioa algida TaxID=105612 RepID=A0A5C6MBY1_9LACO|nr:UDP-N-acetylmuramate dehydrogenase [Dellaglioa algida]MDK1716910.1 UDP-N-acetylmuramate dehydrogenase [Dellaglioa algida]MDK1719684.1 UDP-N-acetylmuramate dehydrogenase [Dellaglioa algida]MDK1721855.1 UDP-N-acetylmuramate dehydrogenase [Dellaglioa algida]MDK1723027.1 UDP-N-acetylmuramate dehydrogenase [Dellaglioa algida]MDK1724646.1 UDP-N-acetylmuramate dehydrogenase [Dellaglioa algida]
MKYDTFVELFPTMRILKKEPLAKYTNTETGGMADVLAFPKTVAEVKLLVNMANENGIPLTVLGNSSNLVVKDGGIRGLVIILTDMDQITVSGTKIMAQAGASLIETTERAYQAGLTHFEFAAGIPGSVGGAVFMNAGAYGGEICQVLTEVSVITRAGYVKTMVNEEMNFGYRHSQIQDDHDIILEATFILKEGNKHNIRETMDNFNFLRASKQPLEYPSCGSVFKRPEGYFAGKLIHDAGLQGYQVGGARVSTKHAGFIVNVDGATATDYMDVIKHVQDTVWEKFNVKLDTEVRIIGED